MNKKFAKVYFLSAIMVALFLALINWNNTPIREKLNNMPIGILRPFIIPELDRNPVVLSSEIIVRFNLFLQSYKKIVLGNKTTK